MTRTRPLVSVITPVYNGARYLAECIESVLAQTYSDWELVIVDNVSTDETATIAAEFADADSRIRLIRAAEFLDIYGNHNRSLAEVSDRSKYCKIVHADDLLYPHCLERLVTIAEAHPSVAIVSSYRFTGHEVEVRTPFRVDEEVVSGREVVRQELLYRGWASGTPSTLLYSMGLIRERPDFYDRTVWHADTDAAYRELMHADCGFAHEILSYTRWHAEAQTSFTMRVNSLRPRDGRLLLRYGRGALSAREYALRLRRWLGGYGVYLARERLRAARRADREFNDFHADEIAYILAEPGADALTRATLKLYRTRLLRPACHGEQRTPSRTLPLG
jgi:glycosyltransferase involved in cell wall biosynthesis